MSKQIVFELVGGFTHTWHSDNDGLAEKLYVEIRDSLHGQDKGGVVEPVYSDKLLSIPLDKIVTVSLEDLGEDDG